jgi:hypothetical protein
MRAVNPLDLRSDSQSDDAQENEADTGKPKRRGGLVEKSDLRASPRNPRLAAMATTVPTVGKKREKPSVYLRPIAQAISQRPATKRKSQAMRMPLNVQTP